jgi:hypothetical protein
LDIELNLDIIHETDAAVLVSDGDREVWLPKSMIIVEGSIITMPEWLAMDKELI